MAARIRRDIGCRVVVGLSQQSAEKFESSARIRNPSPRNATARPGGFGNANRKVRESGDQPSSHCDGIRVFSWLIGSAQNGNRATLQKNV